MEHFNWYSYFGVPHEIVHVAGLIVSVAIFFVGLIITKSYFKDRIIPPTKFGVVSIFDMLASLIFKLSVDILGDKEQANKYFPLFASSFIIILISNLLGLLPGMVPTTDNLNTTLAMGIFIFIYYNAVGIKAQGIVNYLKHLAGPMLAIAPLLFLIELISHIVRPISLGLRLRFNMFGDHLVFGIFSDLVPYVLPVMFIALGAFVCFVQAFVFTLLSIVYIAMASHVEHHGEHEEAHH